MDLTINVMHYGEAEVATVTAIHRHCIRKNAAHMTIQPLIVE